MIIFPQSSVISNTKKNPNFSTLVKHLDIGNACKHISMVIIMMMIKTLVTLANINDENCDVYSANYDDNDFITHQ